jgi:hypothetical protein
VRLINMFPPLRRTFVGLQLSFSLED